MTKPEKPYRQPLLLTHRDPVSGVVFSAVSERALTLAVAEGQRYQAWKRQQPEAIQ